MLAISFEELTIILAVVGAAMMGASVFWKEYPGLYPVGRVFLIVGIVLFFLLLVL